MKIRLAKWLRNFNLNGWGYRMDLRADRLADRLDPPEPVEWQSMGWIEESHRWARPGSIFMAPLQPPKPVTMPDIEEALKGLRFRQPVLPSIKLKKEAIDRLLAEVEIDPLPFQRRFLYGGAIKPLTGIDIIEDKDDDAKD